MNKDIKKLLKDKSGIRLDIGCGQNKKPGFVGIDYEPYKGVDIVHDLETFPWPLPDESVLVAQAIHVIEHINPAKGTFIKFMDEIWRVLKPDGHLLLIFPHGQGRTFVQDPTHVNPCNEVTMAYFDPLFKAYDSEFPNDPGTVYKRYYDVYKPKPWKINQLFYQDNGNVECALIKRREDWSYDKDEKEYQVNRRG